MQRKLFGHRAKKTQDTGRVPGEPISQASSSEGREKGGPAGYEGKEHVKYKNPGFSSHQDKPKEPTMRSHVRKNEMHEMEDNYHMKTPDQTEDTLETKLKRARMKMDAPDHDKPKPLLGNLVQQVPKKGIEDTSGEEEMGPNDMQKDVRKKMAIAVTRRKMKKG